MTTERTERRMPPGVFVLVGLLSPMSGCMLGCMLGCTLGWTLGCTTAAALERGGSRMQREVRSGPPGRGRWVPFLPMTDEFEGTELDPGRWHPNNPGWKGRKPAFFHTGNVEVSGGELRLTMKREDLPNLPAGYHTYTSAAVKSKAKVRYGYFEIKCRPMDSRGSSAFWFYDSVPEIWTEIDIFEMGAGAPGHEHTVHVNAHVFHTLVNPGRHWSSGGKYKAPFRLADGWHVYALEWNEKEIKYYVDGEVVRSMENTHWHQPLYLNFDSETMPNWFGLPEEGTLPSTFGIEYVRAWKRADAPVSDTAKSYEFRFPAGESGALRDRKVTYRLKTTDEGTLLVKVKHGRSTRPARVSVEYDEPRFFGAQRASTIRRTVRVRDKRNKGLLLAFQWSRRKDQEKSNFYRADSVELRSAAGVPPDGEIVFEFVAANGEEIRLKLYY